MLKLGQFKVRHSVTFLTHTRLNNGSRGLKKPYKGKRARLKNAQAHRAGKIISTLYISLILKISAIVLKRTHKYRIGKTMHFEN